MFPFTAYLSKKLCIQRRYFKKARVICCSASSSLRPSVWALLKSAPPAIFQSPPWMGVASICDASSAGEAVTVPFPTRLHRSECPLQRLRPRMLGQELLMGGSLGDGRRVNPPRSPHPSASPQVCLCNLSTVRHNSLAHQKPGPCCQLRCSFTQKVDPHRPAEPCPFQTGILRQVHLRDRVNPFCPGTGTVGRAFTVDNMRALLQKKR